jgi:thioredoxin 1
MSLATATDHSFEQAVLAASHSKPVLVDFGAAWCSPCKMLDPIVEKVAAEYASSLNVVKIDTDENPQLVQEYAIMSAPTLLVFKDGKLVKRLVGYMPQARLVSQLEALL